MNKIRAEDNRQHRRSHAALVAAKTPPLYTPMLLILNRRLLNTSSHIFEIRGFFLPKFWQIST